MFNDYREALYHYDPNWPHAEPHAPGGGGGNIVETETGTAGKLSSTEAAKAERLGLISPEQRLAIEDGADPAQLLGAGRLGYIRTQLYSAAPQATLTEIDNSGALSVSDWAENTREGFPGYTPQAFYMWLLNQPGYNRDRAIGEMAANEIYYNPTTGVATRPDGSPLGPTILTKEQLQANAAAEADALAAAANAALDAFEISSGVEIYRDGKGGGFYYDARGLKVPVGYSDKTGRIEQGIPSGNPDAAIKGFDPYGIGGARARDIPPLPPEQAALLANAGQTAIAEAFAQTFNRYPTGPEMNAWLGGSYGPNGSRENDLMNINAWVNSELPGRIWQRGSMSGPEEIRQRLAASGIDPDSQQGRMILASALFARGGNPFSEDAAARAGGYWGEDGFNLFQPFSPTERDALGNSSVFLDSGSPTGFSQTAFNGEGEFTRPMSQIDIQNAANAAAPGDPEVTAQRLADAFNMAQGQGYSIRPSDKGWTIVDGNGISQGAFSTQDAAANYLSLQFLRKQTLQTEKRKTDTRRKDPTNLFYTPPFPTDRVIGGTSRPESPRPGPVLPDLPPPVDTAPPAPQDPTRSTPIFAFADGGTVDTTGTGAGPRPPVEDWPYASVDGLRDFLSRFGGFWQGPRLEAERYLAPVPRWMQNSPPIGLFRPNTLLDPSQVEDYRFKSTADQMRNQGRDVGPPVFDWKRPAPRTPAPSPVTEFAEGGTVGMGITPPVNMPGPGGRPNLMLDEPAALVGLKSGQTHAVAGEVGTKEMVTPTSGGGLEFTPTNTPQTPAAPTPPADPYKAALEAHDYQRAAIVGKKPISQVLREAARMARPKL